MRGLEDCTVSSQLNKLGKGEEGRVGKGSGKQTLKGLVDMQARTTMPCHDHESVMATVGLLFNMGELLHPNLSVLGDSIVTGHHTPDQAPRQRTLAGAFSLWEAVFSCSSSRRPFQTPASEQAKCPNEECVH